MCRIRGVSASDTFTRHALEPPHPPVPHTLVTHTFAGGTEARLHSWPGPVSAFDGGYHIVHRRTISEDLKTCPACMCATNFDLLRVRRGDAPPKIRGLPTMSVSPFTILQKGGRTGSHDRAVRLPHVRLSGVLIMIVTRDQRIANVVLQSLGHTEGLHIASQPGCLHDLRRETIDQRRDADGCGVATVDVFWCLLFPHPYRRPICRCPHRPSGVGPEARSACGEDGTAERSDATGG